MKHVFPKYEDGKAVLVDESRQPFMDRYTPYHLLNEKNRHRDMNSKAVELWFKKYHGKQIDPETSIKLKPARELVKIRKRDIALAHREYQTGTNLDIDIRNFRREIQSLIDELFNNPKHAVDHIIARAATSKRNTLWDLPFVPLGYTSHKAIDRLKINPKFQPTAEHCFPRTVAVLNIIQWCVEQRQRDPEWKLSCADLISMAYPVCGVVWTTKQENESLKEWQKRNKFEGPTESYTSAGILVCRTGPLIIPFAWQYVAEVYGVDLSKCATPVFEETKM